MSSGWPVLPQRCRGCALPLLLLIAVTLEALPSFSLWYRCCSPVGFPARIWKHARGQKVNGVSRRGRQAAASAVEETPTLIFPRRGAGDQMKGEGTREADPGQGRNPSPRPWREGQGGGLPPLQPAHLYYECAGGKEFVGFPGEALTRNLGYRSPLCAPGADLAPGASARRIDWSSDRPRRGSGSRTI